MCGTVVETDDDCLPPSWSFSFDADRVSYHCPDCVRANIRAIEGKLPEEYW
jgi:hypothetical protein